MGLNLEHSHLSNFYQDAPEKRLALCLFNRATYARSKTIISAMSKYPNIKLTVYLSSALLWDEFGKAADLIEREHRSQPVTFVRVSIERLAPGPLGIAQASGEIALKLAPLLSQGKYHGVIAVADRWETLGAAMAASYQNIPLFHVQGGEITGCIDDKVRHAVSRLADYHFCATHLSKEYLKAMGEEVERIFMTGCPSVDLIRSVRGKRHVAKERYILSIFHPETDNHKEAYQQTRLVMEAALDWCKKHRAKCYWYYPNPDPGREEIIRYLDATICQYPVYFIKAINKAPELFLHQLSGARMIIGNSSCGIRETSWLGVPSVNIGSRQRMRERSYNVIDVDYDYDRLFAAMEVQEDQYKYPKSQLFGVGRAGYLIAQYIQRIDPVLKGPLTYPTWPQFRDKHSSEERFYGHALKRQYDSPRKPKRDTPGQGGELQETCPAG